ncbi:hypothetical protein [Saccharomonospora azurea]|uniref:hypothetical protein n=2 Tax=Saccharomonospora azurea TaxID=40988 RepID=UPI002408F92F|nr:hypothetical protein [Saccharomonospora azurea]
MVKYPAAGPVNECGDSRRLGRTAPKPFDPHAHSDVKRSMQGAIPRSPQAHMYLHVQMEVQMLDTRFRTPVGAFSSKATRRSASAWRRSSLNRNRQLNSVGRSQQDDLVTTTGGPHGKGRGSCGIRSRAGVHI